MLADVLHQMSEFQMSIIKPTFTDFTQKERRRLDQNGWKVQTQSDHGPLAQRRKTTDAVVQYSECGSTTRITTIQITMERDSCNSTELSVDAAQPQCYLLSTLNMIIRTNLERSRSLAVLCAVLNMTSLITVVPLDTRLENHATLSFLSRDAAYHAWWMTHFWKLLTINKTKSELSANSRKKRESIPAVWRTKFPMYISHQKPPQEKELWSCHQLSGLHLLIWTCQQQRPSLWLVEKMKMWRKMNW